MDKTGKIVADNDDRKALWENYVRELFGTENNKDKAKNEIECESGDQK